MPSRSTRPASAVPSRYRKRKRKQPPPPPAPPSRPPPKRRCRAPEEIWQEFQREEEASARKEFHARGFDRSYESSSSAPKTSRRTESPPPEDTATEAQETILNSDLNEKAQRWSAWARPTPSSGRSSAESTTSTGPSLPKEPQENTETPAVICCLLCRRKFPTDAALVRHETHSPLHLANLAKVASSQGGNDEE